VAVVDKHQVRQADTGPFGGAGVAWGDSPEELERAKRTLHEIPVRYALWVEQAFEQLDEFIELSQQKASAVPYHEKIQLVDPFAPPPPAKDDVITRLKRMIPPRLRAPLKRVIHAFRPPGAKS
jgi:hypothetical protein